MAKTVSNVDQLRHRIDSGQTGEKVDYPDPAAAPLGTDAEAGGVPPTRAEVALDAKAAQGAPKPPHPHDGDPGLMLYLGLSVPVMVLMLVVVALAN